VVGGDKRRPLGTKRPESDEEQLLGELFSDYNQFARPLINSSSTVVVTLQFSLMHIKDLVSCGYYSESFRPLSHRRKFLSNVAVERQLSQETF